MKNLDVLIRETLKEIEKRWPESGEDIAVSIRDALGLCLTVGCMNQRVCTDEWDEFCTECIEEP